MQVKPSLAKYIAKDAGISVKGTTCLAEPEKNVRLGSITCHNSWRILRTLALRCMLTTQVLQN